MSEELDLRQVSAAARVLGVPQGWLRQEALAGRIPHLRAGSRIIIHLPTVRQILCDRAASQAGSDSPASSDEQEALA